MRTPILSSVFFLISCISLPFMSIGQCSVDQNDIDTYMYTQDDFGQSFLACDYGQLVELDLPMHHFMNGNIMGLLSIYEGEGYGGALLYTDSLELQDNWGGYLFHILHTPVDVSAGTTYTFRVDYFGEYGVAWANFSDIYGDGQFYWNGQPHSTVDMGFMAHIDQATQSCLSWTGMVSDDWNDAQNWFPSQVPDSMDCVIISDFANVFPRIQDDARTADLTLEQNASLDLMAGSRLYVHGDIVVQGDASFIGEVILEDGDSPREINGSPIFNKLKINGLFYTTEPIEILNHLDMRDGYLANFGTELYLNVGNGYHGHAYIPEDIIVGNVIIKRHNEGTGAQLIGLPFTQTDHDQIMSLNDFQELFCFKDEYGFEEFDSNWQLSTDTSQCFGVQDAILLEGGYSDVSLEGQTTNTDQTITGGYSETNELGEIQMIGNPYPSVIDWDKVVRSPGSARASYLWLPEKQQFGSRIEDIQTNDMGNILHPSDAILVELDEDDEIFINYGETALSPSQLYNTEFSSGPENYQLRLGVTGALGADETLILFNDEATGQRDARYDALKIPSLNEGVPTLASRSATRDFLSINTIPFPDLGTRVDLYLNPGTEGAIVFTPLLIDLGVDYEAIYLVDTKYQIYHDLLSYGSYQTEVLLEDERGRFVLQFGTYFPDPPSESPVSALDDPLPSDIVFDPVPVDPNLPQDPQDPEDAGPMELVEGHWEINTVDNEVTIWPEMDVIIPVRTQVSIYTAQGKLVFDRVVTSSSTKLQYRLHVSSGVYLVKIQSANKTQVKKVWID